MLALSLFGQPGQHPPVPDRDTAGRHHDPDRARAAGNWAQQPGHRRAGGQPRPGPMPRPSTDRSTSSRMPSTSTSRRRGQMPKGSDVIASFLASRARSRLRAGRGMIMHLVDSLTPGRIRLVSVHHEQAAAFAADAMGRMTGVPGVAMATSGPGATNLLTGIGSCYFDSTPAVFITGQVNRARTEGRPADPSARLPGDRHRRDGRAGDQDGEARRARPRSSPYGAPPHFRGRARAARGRCSSTSRWTSSGAEIEAVAADASRPGRLRLRVRLRRRLRRGAARRVGRGRAPLILAGGGVRAAGAAGALPELVDRLGVPVVTLAHGGRRPALPATAVGSG